MKIISESELVKLNEFFRTLRERPSSKDIKGKEDEANLKIIRRLLK